MEGVHTLGLPTFFTTTGILWSSLKGILFGYQNTDFEAEVSPKLEAEANVEIADAPLTEITIRDFAAIMLMKPISAKPWLNDLVKQTKSEI